MAKRRSTKPSWLNFPLDVIHGLMEYGFVDTAALEIPVSRVAPSRVETSCALTASGIRNRKSMRYESQSGASVDRYSSNVHCSRAGMGSLPVSTNFQLSLAHHSESPTSWGTSRWVRCRATHEPRHYFSGPAWCAGRSCDGQTSLSGRLLGLMKHRTHSCLSSPQGIPQ